MENFPQAQVPDRVVQEHSPQDNTAPLVNWTAHENQIVKDAQTSTQMAQYNEQPEVDRTRFHVVVRPPVVVDPYPYPGPIIIGGHGHPHGHWHRGWHHGWRRHW